MADECFYDKNGELGTWAVCVEICEFICESKMWKPKMRKGLQNGGKTRNVDITELPVLGPCSRN